MEPTHVLAIDLGTGGPKVALVTTDGDIVGHEFEPTSMLLSEGGGAEQDPEEWWTAITRAARRLLDRGLVDVADIEAVSVTAQWSGTVAVDAVGQRPHERGHLDGLAWRHVHPRGHRRHRQGPGLRGPEAAELRAEVGRRAQPLGQGPHRAHPLHPQRAPRRLPGHGDVPRAGRLPQPAAHRPRRVEPRLHHGPLAHRQPRHATRSPTTTSSSRSRGSTASSCPSWSPRPRSSAPSPTPWPTRSGWRRAPRW